MAIYRVHIRCSHMVSAEQKFLWQNATSFTGELVCSAHLSFDRFPPATAQDCRMSSATVLSPSLPLRGCQGPSFALLAPEALPDISFPCPGSSSWGFMEISVWSAHTSSFSGHAEMVGDTVCDQMHTPQVTVQLSHSAFQVGFLQPLPLKTGEHLLSYRSPDFHS